MHAARGSAAMGLLLVAAFAAAAGCGYRLRGTGSSLPPGIRTVSVPVFKNLTTRYELDVKLTRAVIDELVARGQVSVAADPAAADAVLEGEITGFTANPIGFTGAGQADRYALTVTAKVTLKERATAKALFTNPCLHLPAGVQRAARLELRIGPDRGHRQDRREVRPQPRRQHPGGVLGCPGRRPARSARRRSSPAIFFSARTTTRPRSSSGTSRASCPPLRAASSA